MRRRTQVPLSLFWVSCLWLAPALADEDEDPFGPDNNERASSHSESGPELGLRLGLTTLSGDLEDDKPVSSLVSGMLPLWVDAGYRLDDRWFIGFYWQYALGIRSLSSESSCETCVHSAIRYGIQANYSLVRTQAAHVWAGLRVGRQSFETVDEDTKRGQAYSGWEPVGLQLGSSWRPNLGIEIGPFWSLGYGQMSKANTVCYAPDRAECPPEENRSVAGGTSLWFNTFGVRAVFLP